MDRDYSVIDSDGEIVTHLNKNLAIKQKVTDEQLEALKLSHLLRSFLFDTAEKSLSEPLKLQMLANVFDSLETEQQKLWNFEQNPDMHMFFNFPGCLCPKMDNRERLGTPYKIINHNCPIHGETK
jgi:hypothetical protein